MKITNQLSLPQSFVQMASSEYTYKDDQYSVTSLLKGVRETLLLRRYHSAIEQDVSDMIWMLFGQAVHHILEQQEGKEHDITEGYIVTDIKDGYKLSGRYDLYNELTRTVVDYKTASVWKVIYKDFDDVRQQLLMYAWMLRQKNIDCDKGQAVFILKDHSKTKAKYDANYPNYPVVVVDFYYTERDFKEIEQFIYYKFEQIKQCENLPDNELPVCTKEERWATDDKYAVMKKGRKSALRVLDSQDNAEEWMTNNSGDYIEYRKAEDKKCIEYCSCNQYCNYYHKEVIT